MNPVAAFSDYARRYTEQGWALIRVDGKKAKGTGWQQTKPDPNAEHAAGVWSDHGKRHNLGVVLGPSGLAVVEYDTDAAGTKLIELLNGELPTTPTAQSGSGRLHFYFRAPDGVEKVAKDGLELRVGPHMVVAPPSIHPGTGEPYRWLRGLEPWTVPLADLPADVLAYFAHERRNGHAPPIGDVIPIGEIDTTLTSLAGTMRRRGASEAAIYAALVEILPRCENGHAHTEKDCRRIAHSVGTRYAPSSGTGAPRPGKIVATPLAEISMRSIEWLERPLWQTSAFQLLAGPKGAGKGTYLASLAARVTRTGRNVIFLATEDSPEIDLKPRLVAADAVEARCSVIRVPVQLPDDISGLREMALNVGNVGLFVIDPVANHIGDSNSSSDTEVRHAIAPLNRSPTSSAASSSASGIPAKTEAAARSPASSDPPPGSIHPAQSCSSPKTTRTTYCVTFRLSPATAPSTVPHKRSASKPSRSKDSKNRSREPSSSANPPRPSMTCSPHRSRTARAARRAN